MLRRAMGDPGRQAPITARAGIVLQKRHRPLPPAVRRPRLIGYRRDVVPRHPIPMVHPIQHMWLPHHAHQCAHADTSVLHIPGGLHELEFLQWTFCTKSLYAICSVFFLGFVQVYVRHCKRPLFLMSNCWEPYIICSLIFKKWHRFCRARICRFIFSPAPNPPPPRVPQP